MQASPRRSEVAHFREQHALHKQAAQQGLSGLAIVANHESITARMQRGAQRILHLIAQGKHQEAQALLFSQGWNSDEQGDCGSVSQRRQTSNEHRREERDGEHDA